MGTASANKPSMFKSVSGFLSKLNPYSKKDNFNYNSSKTKLSTQYEKENRARYNATRKNAAELSTKLAQRGANQIGGYKRRTKNKRKPKRR